MILFWDTSAIVAAVQQEPHSDAARKAVAAATCSFAWAWLKVEAESALGRRGATALQWAELAKQLAALRFEHIPQEELSRLCSQNREWRLRAADAGHLFCFTRVAAVIPDVQLVTFDDEMLAVARRLALPLWSPSPPATGRVREDAVAYQARPPRRSKKASPAPAPS